MAAETERAIVPLEPMTPRAAGREGDVTAHRLISRPGTSVVVGACGPGDELQQVAGGTPQLVWVTGADGHREWLNSRWYAFTGSTPDRACRDGWVSCLPPADRDHTLGRWRHALATDDLYDVECRLQEATSGGHRWFLGRARPLRSETADDRSGPILRWFRTWTDIHEQRLARDRAERRSPDDLRERMTHVGVPTERRRPNTTLRLPEVRP